MPETKTTICRWCNRVMPDDPGAYYHKAACEERVLQLAKELFGEWSRRDRSGTFTEWLDKRIESARYVGD